MPLSPFIRETTLNLFFRNDTTYTPTANHTVKLHTADPGVDGTANGVADAGYSDASYTSGWDAPEDHGSPEGTIVKNSAVISFGTADGSFTASHVTVWDQNSPENLLYNGALSSPVPFSAGNDIEFPAGNLKLGFEGTNAAGDGDGDGS